MNKFVSLVLLALFVQYAVSETKSKEKSSRAKKEDVAATASPIAYLGSTSVFPGSYIDENAITPAPENILNTPTTTSRYQNPIFIENEGTYNPYTYNEKTAGIGPHYSHLYNNDGKYVNTGNQYNKNNQGSYYSGINNPGYHNYPGYNDDGSYKYNAYNSAKHAQINPSQYSGIHYPYQHSSAAYQPVGPGYNSGNQGTIGQGYYNGGVNYNDGSYKSNSGFLSTSTPASVTSTTLSSGALSGSLANAGAADVTANAYKNVYQSGVAAYPGYINNQYKPQSTGSYDYTKYNNYYPGYQSGQTGGYYNQGYSGYGSAGIPPSPLTSVSSSSSSSSASKSSTGSVSVGAGAKKPNVQGFYNPVSSSYSNSYPGYTGYQTGTYNSGAYNLNNNQRYDYSKAPLKPSEVAYTPGYNNYNLGSFPLTPSKPSQSSLTSSSGLSSSTSGLSSFGKVKPVSSVGYSYPGYPNYQTGVSGYNANNPYSGYSGYDYSKYYSSYPGYEANKAVDVKNPVGYNVIGSAVTSTPAPLNPYSSSFSTTSKSPIIPSVVPNTISSTATPTTTPLPIGGYQQSLYPGYNTYSGYPGYQSGYYDQYNQNLYNTNQYSKIPSQLTLGQGIKSSYNFQGASSPATPIISSGIVTSTLPPSPYSGSIVADKSNAALKGTSAVSGSVPQKYPNSYDFSAYAKKTPAVTTVSTVSPSYYNYPGYQAYPTGKYDVSGNKAYSGYDYSNQPGSYYGTGYKSGYDSKVTGYNSAGNYNLGAFTNDGKYQPSFTAQTPGYPGLGYGHINNDHAGNYNYDNTGYYQHGGIHHSYPGYVAPHVASDLPLAYSTTVAPVTSTPTSTAKSI